MNKRTAAEQIIQKGGVIMTFCMAGNAPALPGIESLSAMKRRMTHLYEILTAYDTEPMEVFLGLIAFGWGVIFLLWGARSFRTPNFAALAQLVSHQEYGAVLLVYGSMRLFAVSGESLRIRRWISLLGVFLWVTVGVSFWKAGTGSPGTYTMFLFALACVHFYVRRCREARLRQRLQEAAPDTA